MKVIERALISAVLGLGLALAFAMPAAATEYPAGFDERKIAGGLTAPTAAAWAPDGRVFVAEKRGTLKVVPAGETAGTTILNISGHVSSYGDRGLLGVAVDSAFSVNGFVYLLYTYDVNRLSPDSPSRTVSRLTRIKVNPDNTLVNPSHPETVLLGSHVSGPCPAARNISDCIPSEGASHSIGTVRSAPDGTLYVGSGDASSFNSVDSMAFRTYDERSFAGKIIHVDRNGNGLPGHRFCPADKNLTHVCTKLHAKGFRNPFRFALRPNGGLTVGDVGWNTREEIDLIGRGGSNYGWPCYEGTIRTPGYRDRPECSAQYAKEGGPQENLSPTHDYTRRTGGAAVVGGPTYTGDEYPTTYRGAVFFGDFARGFVKRLELDDRSRVTAVRNFATGWFGTDLGLTPTGDLAYVDFGTGAPGTGSVKRAFYSPGNRRPEAVAVSSPSFGPVPLSVGFDATGSSDRDGDPLSYDWDFGDGSEHSSETQPSHLYAREGRYTATLTVTDGQGGSDTQAAPIDVGNSPPTPGIELPLGGSRYRDGTAVKLKGSATDPEQGSLAASSLHWRVSLHHGDHVHPVRELDGVAAGEFRAGDDHDADSFYEISLTALDERGASSTRTIEIYPEIVGLSLDSSPGGAPLSYGGRSATAPEHKRTAVGYRTTVSAAWRFARAGRLYAFVRWSDGGARVHDVTIPARATRLVALYHELADKAAGAPATASSVEGPGRGPRRAVDRDFTTRWSPASKNGQWWQVDLRRPRVVDQVWLDWGAAYPLRYEILTSNDGHRFRRAAQVSLDEPRVEKTRLPARLARYVRVRSLRVTRRGISLFDARVFGSPDPSASATRYRDGVLQSRTLASYWRLGDGDTTAADAAGINHGTYRGTIPAPGLIAGGSDRARRFDGRDDFVDLRPGLFGAPPQVSVEAWFRPARARRSGREILVTDAAQAFADGFTLAVDNAGRPLFGVATRSTRRASATSPGSLKAGSTYHLAGTYDGSWLRLYVNGVERRAVRFSGGIRYLAGRDLLFGKPHSTRPPVHLSGRLDEVALYRGALSAATVKAHRRAGSP